MGLEFITRIIRSTAIYSLVIALAWSLYFDWMSGLGFLIGVAWSLVNLYMLRSIIKESTSPDRPRKDVAVILGLFKFPVLYFLGYLIIKTGWFSVYSLLAGFSFMFVVIIMKILGRMFLGLEGISFKPNHSKESR